MWFTECERLNHMRTITIVRNVRHNEIPQTGDVINVSCWSGNVKPYSARAYRDGKFVGKTGFTKSEGSAITIAKSKYTETSK